MNKIISIKNLSFRYSGQENQALKNLNLTIPPGQFVGITGPAGAGKSTLSLCLNGIIPHYQKGRYEGYVHVDGLDVAEVSCAKLANVIGTVFQDPEAQIVSLKVDEEIAFGLENLGFVPAEMEKRIEEALEMAGISSLRQSSTAALSGGQKQRVAIAAVLAMRPKIIVLDEPTSELDPGGAAGIFNVLEKLNQNFGITIVMIEQNMELLARFAQRIIVLNEGRIVVDGRPQEVFSDSRYLEEIGVQIPQMVKLANELNSPNIPLNLSDGFNLVEWVLTRKGVYFGKLHN